MQTFFGRISKYSHTQVFVMGDEAHPTQTCVELLCETDLFLYYIQVPYSYSSHACTFSPMLLSFTYSHTHLFGLVVKPSFLYASLPISPIFVRVTAFAFAFISFMQSRFCAQNTFFALVCMSLVFHIIAQTHVQEVDASVFTHLQGQQKLIMDYNEYHKFIIKIIMNCLQNPQVCWPPLK